MRLPAIVCLFGAGTRTDLSQLPVSTSSALGTSAASDAVGTSGISASSGINSGVSTSVNDTELVRDRVSFEIIREVSR